MIDLNGKQILVTGGCGFIGSNFIEMCLSMYPGVEIHNIDKMGVGSRSLNPKLKPSGRYHFIPFDLRDEEDITPIFKKLDFDYIFHFAAESHVDRSISGPVPFIANNVGGMVALLELVRNYFPKARVINVSTDEVYGDLKEDDPPFTENTLLDPHSPYSASKASADLIAKSYCHTYGLDVVTTHCCNNYGPYQAQEKFIPTVIRNILRGTHIPLYGNGENIREWIFVDDHNKSLLEIAGEGFYSGRSYNIYSGVEKNNKEIILDIADILGKSSKIAFVEDRKGHDFRYALESLSYTRHFKLEDYSQALKKTVEFYKNVK